MSRALTVTNFEIAKVLLECGAETNHRLQYQEIVANAPTIDIPGPTLLHAVLAKKIDFEFEAQVIRYFLLFMSPMKR